MAVCSGSGSGSRQWQEPVGSVGSIRYSIPNTLYQQLNHRTLQISVNHKNQHSLRSRSYPKNGYRKSNAGTKVSLMVRGLVQRTKLR